MAAISWRAVGIVGRVRRVLEEQSALLDEDRRVDGNLGQHRLGSGPIEGGVAQIQDEIKRLLGADNLVRPIQDFVLAILPFSPL